MPKEIVLSKFAVSEERKGKDKGKQDRNTNTFAKEADQRINTSVERTRRSRGVR